MLTESQRDYICNLHDKENDQDMRAAIAKFADMHSQIKSEDEFLVDLSIDLLEIGMACYRGGYKEEGFCVLNLAAVVVNKKRLDAMIDYVMNLETKALMANVIGATIMDLLKKTKAGGTDAS